MLLKNHFKLTVACICSTALFCLALYSCNNHRDKPGKGLYLQCVRLDRADIQRWMDAGTQQADSGRKFNRILLQLYSPAIRGSDSIGLIAYPATSYTSVDIDGRTVMKASDSCTQKVDGEVILANNFVSLKKLEIIDTTTGRLKDFLYITFTPVKGKENYLVYDAEVTTSDQGKLFYRQVSDPCPPYCPEEETK